MTMPMMPGLTGAEGEDENKDQMGGDGGGGDTLESLLEELDDQTMATLVAEADEAYMNGQLDEYMNAPPGEEPDGGEEGETPEGGDTVEAEEGETAPQPLADPMVAVDTAAAIVEEIAAEESQLADLLAAAEDSDEGDPKPIKESLEVVSEAMGEAEDAKEKIEKAAKDEDAEGVAEAVAEAEGAATKAKEAVAKAKQTAKGQVDAAKAEVEVSPLEAWAEKNS